MGEEEFFSPWVPILETDTHYIDYGGWDGYGLLTIAIDHESDGTIDELWQLPNQAGAFHVYLPLVLRSQ